MGEVAGSAQIRITGPQDFAEIFGASRETVLRLETFAEALVRWQKAVQLVAPSTLDSVWQRHFADSAQILALAPQHVQTWLDLGSGAGFPGLVVAILAAQDPTRRSETRFCLIESDTRKAAFLREVSRLTGVAVEILGTRIEFPATQARVGAADVISARALAPLSKLLALAEPYWKPETLGIFLKGRSGDAEVAQASATWRFDAQVVPSRTESDGRIVCMSNMSRVM
jgi:16S rRNA (guanine527-N7)-methyltransferase